MNRHRRLLAVTLLLAVSGCGLATDEQSATTAAEPATSSAAAEPEVDEIAWTDCDDQIQPLIAERPGGERDLAFACGRTAVPIDYTEPDGDALPLFLVRAVAASQTDRIGSLVINPGGPGGSGVDAAVGLALTLPEEILARFDLVGFDPRGVGLSTPVECIPIQVKEEIVAAEPRPTSTAQFDAAFTLAEDVAAGCAEKYGAALGAFSTEATARDLDRLRQALGDDRLTYLGYSYGTTLGSTYAELFPDRVRALVLDAAVDPDAGPQAAAEASAAGLEAGFDAFAANCTALIGGCPVGADPRQFVADLLTQTGSTPIPSAEPAETRRATPGVLLTAVLAALYDPASWPQLAQALAAAQGGNAAGLFTLADGYAGRLPDGTYANLFDANVAINCADTDAEFSRRQVRDLAREWNTRYPLFGAGSAVSLYTCSVWEAPRTPLPERDAAGSDPILVVGNSGDPVTPLPGAVDLARNLDAGILLTWQGQGHTAYPKTDCVTAAVNAYLIDLTAPEDGLTCPA